MRDAAVGAVTPRRRRVLVVDDDPGIRYMLVSLLIDEGFETRTAEDGERALRLAAEWQPHVILVDLVMPRMNGYAFVREYRKLSVTLETRASVFAMTAAGPTATRSAGEHGFDEIVVKPYKVDRLLELVTSHCRLRAGNSAVEMG